MGALALAYESDDKYHAICSYLNENDGYWLQKDVWMENDAVFEESGIVNKKAKARTVADFSAFKHERTKNEIYDSKAFEREGTYNIWVQRQLSSRDT